MPDPIRIVIADDHAVVRQGLILVLRQEDDFEVVGEARDGAEAILLCRTAEPDLAILDWRMPPVDGLRAARTIKESQPEIRTLILSGAPVEAAVLDALENGVDGFVHKDISSDGLCHAVRVVASGQRYLGPEVAQALLERSNQAAAVPEVTPLSPRETEILQLMATPLTYREMAHNLSISEATVHTHVKRIFAKLHQSSRTGAVIAGLREGLITVDL